ncbi:O-antigen ligase family protein [Myroides sp. LJL119]
MGKKLIFSTTGLFCFLLPLSTKWANIGIALLFVSLLFYIIENRKKGIHKSISWLSILTKTTGFIIVLLTIGLLYTDYFFKAIKYYENFNSYLLLPILFAFIPKDVLEHTKHIALRYFVLGTISCSLLLLSNNFYTYFLEKGGFIIDRELFSSGYTYVRFSSFLNFHPTMIGIYLVFGLVIINEVKTLFNKQLRIVFSTVLLMCLVFMNSRVPFLILGVYLIFKACLFIYLVFKTKKGYNSLLRRTILVLFILMGMVYAVKDTYIYQRLTKQVAWDFSQDKGSQKKIESRLTRWTAVLDIALETPLIGNGSLSKDSMALKAYEKHDLQYSYKHRLTPHNQFLTFFLEYGIFGLGLFLLFLINQLISAFKSRDVVWGALIAFIGIACLFDDILYLNIIVIFLTFFSNLFFFCYWNKNTLERK